ncbi:MAG: thiamine pyrophosphate-binding protein [Rhodococcus sp. (in: high G+C Gram-positive bacteria)]
MKIFEACAHSLLGHGVEVMFGLMGDANMLFVAHYRENGGDFVPTVHESGAVAMADSWSRFTGRVGVATVTHGPGLSNTMTALIEAVRSRSQVLLLTGDTPAEPTHFQRLDISSFAEAAGAGYEKVYRKESLVRDLNRSFQRAVAERRPIVVNIPADLMLDDAGKQTAVHVAVPPAPMVPALDDLDAALGLIASAKRPIVLAGRGAVLSGARDTLVALAEKLAAPVATSVLAKDLFRGHPANLGICGSLSHSVASAAIAESDLIISFGASLNVYTTFHGEWVAEKNLVQIDVDPGRFGWYVSADEYIAGDATAVAEAIGAALDEVEHTPVQPGWLQSVEQRLARFTPGDEYTDRTAVDTVDVRTACLALDSTLPAGRIMVSDIGRFTNAVWPRIAVEDARRFTTMGGFGAIGLGLAGAIGAAIAAPGELTVAVVGDGGFIMHLGELTTAVRRRLPLVVLVFDDSAYGAEHNKLQRYGADPAHSLNVWPEFVPIAEAMGATAVSIRKIEEIDDLVCLTRDLRGPCLVDIKLDPEVNILA